MDAEEERRKGVTFHAKSAKEQRTSDWHLRLERRRIGVSAPQREYGSMKLRNSIRATRSLRASQAEFLKDGCGLNNSGMEEEFVWPTFAGGEPRGVAGEVANCARTEYRAVANYVHCTVGRRRKSHSDESGQLSLDIGI